MGRNKIVIQPITNERNRQATFTKRKNGLVKKAMELSILCSCDVVLLVILGGKVFEYSSKELQEIMNEYGGLERLSPLTNNDYDEQFGKKQPVPRKRKNSKSDDLDHSDDTRDENQSVPSPPPTSSNNPPNPSVLMSNHLTKPTEQNNISHPEVDPLTPRTAQRYTMANKMYEDLLHNIHSDHSSNRSSATYETSQNFTAPQHDASIKRSSSYQSYDSFHNPSLLLRSVDSVNPLNHLSTEDADRRLSDGMIRSNPSSIIHSDNQPASLASSLVGVKRKQRFDRKQLTIAIPDRLSHKERVPVPVDQLARPSNTDQSDQSDSNSQYGSESSLLDLNTNGMSPLPMTPGAFSIPQWSWSPSPRNLIRPLFSNYGIEPQAIKKRKI